MEKMIISVITAFGACCIILILTLIIALIWDVLARKFIDACRNTKYCYDIIMWLCIKNRGRRAWRKMRKQFVDFKDVGNYEYFVENYKEFMIWQTSQESEELLSVAEDSVDGAAEDELNRQDEEKKIAELNEKAHNAVKKTADIVIKKYEERIKILEDGIRKHKKECPDDDYGPDDELWALVEHNEDG